MPTVKARESRSDFVSRCIPVVIREGASQAHAVAKCGGIFDTHVTTNRTRVVPSNPLKADPTRSATLRRIFTTDISVRFTRLKRKLQRLIVEQDAFGLTGNQNKERNDVLEQESGRANSSAGVTEARLAVSAHPSSIERRAGGVENTERAKGTRLANSSGHSSNSSDSDQRGGAVSNISDGNLTTNAGIREKTKVDTDMLEDGRVTVNAGRWAFQTDKRKVKLFEKWLKTQVKIDVLPGTKAKANEAYWKKYVQQGYEKGAGRAFDDVRKPALASGQEQLAFFAGTKEEFLRQSFAKPVAVRKVKRLAERVFTGLKDVTDDMSDILTQQLTEGLTQGMNPKDIARKMIKEGIGDKVRGVQSRAERIARTEIIRAHAEGQLDALEELGVTEVGVMVEWSTAGDDLVCPLCSALDSVVLTIKEARGILPRHPNCRCAHIPANVGESKKGQQRGKTEVKGAFDDSIRAERKKGSLAEKKKKSQWLGADKTITPKRPVSVLDKPKITPIKIKPKKVTPTKVTPKELPADVPKPLAKPKALKVTDEIRGASSGQVNSTLKAFTDSGKEAAFLDYSVYDGRVHIQLVESKIKGLRAGEHLFDQLAKEHGYESIDWGMLTEDGARLRKRLDKKYGFERGVETISPKTLAKKAGGKLLSGMDDLDIYVEFDSAPAAKKFAQTLKERGASRVAIQEAGGRAWVEGQFQTFTKPFLRKIPKPTTK